VQQALLRRRPRPQAAAHGLIGSSRRAAHHGHSHGGAAHRDAGGGAHRRSLQQALLRRRPRPQAAAHGLIGNSRTAAQHGTVAGAAHGGGVLRRRLQQALLRRRPRPQKHEIDAGEKSAGPVKRRQVQVNGVGLWRLAWNLHLNISYTYDSRPAPRKVNTSFLLVTSLLVITRMPTGGGSA
jgi:hypothetical protein